MDITKFCATDADYREHLRTPFHCSEGIAAANGHVFVCIPDDGGSYPAVVDSMKGSAAKFKAYIGDAGRQWFDAASIQLPERVACPHCDGVGHLYEEDCDDCDGEGSFQHGSHWYNCKECEGSGKVKTTTSGGKKETCWSCGGTGEGYKAVLVGGSYIQRRYLVQLAELPGCRLGVLGGLDAVSFTFDGGWGVVMPCRGD
jgi:hypothetical protein